MKSKINTLADYKDFEFETEIDVKIPESELEKEFRHVTRPFKQKQNVDTIERGDIATLTVIGKTPKFNKSGIPVTIGGGLYSKELEEQLVGVKVGDTKLCTVDGDEVSVSVIKAVRTVYPEPTDEMVKAYSEAHDDYADINTVAEYRARVSADYAEDKKNDAIGETVQNIIEYVLTHTDFDFDNDELEQVKMGMMGEMCDQLKQEKGLEWDQLTDEDCMVCFGAPNKDEIVKMIDNDCEWTIATSLWSLACNGLDSANYEFDDDECYSMDFIFDYVREKLNFKEA